jgi:very-short-patch-repair endonuclease
VLCEYGCGREGIKQLKNKKWCCSKFSTQCPINRKKSGDGNRKKKRDKPEVCDYGCKQESKYHFKNDKWCCGRSTNSCLGVRKKLSNSAIGYKQPEERKKSHGRKLRKLWKDPKSKYNSKERDEKLRKWMLSGHAVYMNEFIKNPSKPQVELWKLVTKICPYVYLNFSVTHLKNTYSIDISIPKLEIAIEFDGGYWHQDEEKDLKRQEELEEDGWIFLRYKDEVPKIEQIKDDIKKLLERRN